MSLKQLGLCLRFHELVLIHSALDMDLRMEKLPGGYVAGIDRINVNLTTIHQRSCFAFLIYSGGWVAIVNSGVGVVQ